MRIVSRTVGPFAENSYLVVDEASRRAVLVDPGDEPDVLMDMVRESGASVEAIWLTHAHLDHVGGIAGIRRHLTVPIHVHPLDRPLYDRAAIQAAVYGVPFEQPPAPDHDLAEGDVLALGALRFGVLHVPGHAPGHVVFVGHDVMLGGDLLFAGSIGRTDLPFCDPAAMDRSLERVAGLDPRLTVYPGHGPETTIGVGAGDESVSERRGSRRAPMIIARIPVSAVTTVLLSGWLGAALLLSASVAPAAFAALPTRALAGDVVGRVLPVVLWTGVLFGGGSILLQARRGLTAARGWAACVVLVCVLNLIALAVGHAIGGIREAIGGPVDALPLEDHRRMMFGLLHGVSVTLLGIAMIAALAAIILALRSARAPLQT